MRFAQALILLSAIFCGNSWAEPSLDDFLKDWDIRDFAVSPDGRHIALVINSGEHRIVTVRNLEDPALPAVGAFSEDLVRPSLVYWGNNDRLLVSMSVPVNISRVQRDREKKEDFNIRDYFAFSRMIAVDKDIGNPVVLLEGEPALRNNISLSRISNFLPKKPDHVLMVASRNGRRSQYEVNINTGEAELITTGSKRTYAFLNDEEGRPAYRFDYLRRSKAIEIYKYEGSGNWERNEKIYLNKDDEDSLDTNNLVALSGEDLVYRERDEETGYYGLIVVNSETKERRTLVSLPDQDVRGLLFDDRADQLIGYTVEQDIVRHVYFDAERQARYDKIADKVGDRNFRVSNLGAGGHSAIVSASGANDPFSLHLWDFETQSLRHLADASRVLSASNLAIPRVATYKARDGQEIRAYLLMPQGYDSSKSYPTVIYPHGGPHARNRASYYGFAQFMATRGYIVLQPNFRGSVGYGRSFEEAGYKQWGGLMQDDLTDAVAFMVEQGYTDPDRVCIIGASYGGYAALMGAIKTPELFNCAASLNGVTHLVRQIKHDMKNLVDKHQWDELLYRRIGHPDDDREMLDAASPALRADEIRIPVLIIAGEEDDNVPFEQAKMMVKALKKAGADYEYIRVEDTGHNVFYFREDKKTVYEAGGEVPARKPG